MVAPTLRVSKVTWCFTPSQPIAVISRRNYFEKLNDYRQWLSTQSKENRAQDREPRIETLPAAQSQGHHTIDRQEKKDVETKRRKKALENLL